jgi:chaperone required for assembly of F1-ATPase
MQHNLILPQALAEAIAAEWEAQGENIIPASMPLMQLASTMTDKCGGHDRPAMNAEIVKYAASDLICYFAATPPELVKRQEAEWLPLLDWLADRHGAKLERVTGIQYYNQPAESLEALNKAITGLNPAAFTVAQAATALCGSAVIALALLDGYLDADSAYRAATVDENYQLETWGEDALARKRLDHIKKELQSLAQFRDLIGAA